MKSILKKLFKIILLAALSELAMAQVNTYYVNGATGSDTNAGTSLSTAWKTVNHADSALVLGPSGTIVHVAAGTYAGATSCYNSGLSAVWCLTHGGTSETRRVTYISDTRWGAIVTNGQVTIIGPVDRPGTTPEGAPWGQYITFQGFQVGPYAADGQGIDTRGDYTDILNNYVHDIGTNGNCYMSGGIVQIPNGHTPNTGNGGLIDSNLVVRIGWSTSLQSQTCNTEHGIYPSFAGVVVSNNVVIGGASKGIQYGGEGACNGAIVHNTLIGNGEVGIITAIGSGDPTCNGVGANVMYAGNLCVDNGQQSGNGGPSTACTRLYAASGNGNNVDYNMNGDNYPNPVELCGVSGVNPPGNPSACGPNIGVTGNQAVPTTGTNMFTNYNVAGGGDYHLKPNTPPIGSGGSTAVLKSLVYSATQSNFLTAMSHDFDGNPRPDVTSIGAYEAASATVAPNPPTNLTVTTH